MEQIGIRELKAQTSEILRRVREDGDSFEITYHGRAIARVVPIAGRSAPPLADFWKEWDQLSQAISSAWPSDVSAVDAIREERRDR